MINYLLVSLGAAIGGGLRFGISRYTYKILPVTFPYGTLIVNVIGSFLIGIIMFYLDPKELITPRLRLFLTVGFCGGFTTFSTFSYESFSLFRDSQFILAGLNIIFNVLVCLTGIYLAYVLTKILN